MPRLVVCAGVTKPLTEAEVATDLWDTLGTGSDIDDASDEDVIEDPSWNMEPLHQESDSCSEEIRRASYISLFCHQNSLCLDYIRLM
jgi:hypothetical protein